MKEMESTTVFGDSAGVRAGKAMERLETARSGGFGWGNDMRWG